MYNVISNIKQVLNCDYFINKFEAIPENLWCTGVFNYENKFCAKGHCGQTKTGATAASLAIDKLFEQIGVYVVTINDGRTKNYQQPTPKQRILAALYDIKGLLAIKEAETIIADPVCV